MAVAVSILVGMFVSYYLARRSLPGALNFAVLQWMGIRLAYGETEAEGVRGRWWSPNAPPKGARVSWYLLRYVWPLTGWWSDYRWIWRRG